MKKIRDFLKEIPLTRFVLQSVIAAVLIALVGIVYAATGAETPLIWIIVVILYVAGVFAYSYFSDSMINLAGEMENASFVSGMNLDLIVKMNIPVIMCNSSETIIWHNSALTSRLTNRKATGIKFDEFCGVSLDSIRQSNSENGTPVSLDGYDYSVRCYPFSSKGKKYYLTLWDDVSEIVNLNRTISDEETQVALIMADNLEELAQYAKDNIRTAASEIEVILKAWASSAGAILKEYQSDRYICIFRSAELKKYVESKFDVLDKVHEIRIGESSLSVTISMGISAVSGTLAEKERVASEALDMALQRGGDQVVIKDAKGLQFYGGKNQSVQKRTKVRARVIANELASLIANSSRVIVMGHKAPDFDCIGACMGIARLASFCGIPFTIIANEKDQNFAKCYERVSAVPEYSERVILGADEAQDLIGSDTLTVIVDVNNNMQFEAPQIAEISSRVVYIDHHRKTAEFDEAPLISYIEPSASSACELVAEILEQSLPAGKLYKEEADVMYAGILLDTKQFTRNTGVRTFSAAQYLRDEGASPSDSQTMFKSDISDFISEARFESNVVLYRKFIAISCNDSSDNTPADRISAAKAADKLLTVEGVKASFALCRIGEKIHISARSTGEINVQLILEKLEGGGHFDSAATQLQGEMTEALIRLKGAIDEYINENIK